MTENTKKHGARYPWDDWFALGSFRLRRGEHFTCQVHGMVQSARTAATKRGLRIHVQAGDATLTIRVVRE